MFFHGPKRKLEKFVDEWLSLCENVMIKDLLAFPTLVIVFENLCIKPGI